MFAYLPLGGSRSTFSHSLSPKEPLSTVSFWVGYATAK